MKRTTLLLTLLLIITLPLAAQNFRIGATAGVNLNDPQIVESKMGFSVGAKGEFGFKGLSEGWYMDAALLLESHAWKCTFWGPGFPTYKWLRQTVTPWYLNVPVHVGYRFPVSQNVKLFVNAGPYMAIGLFGKMKHDAVMLDGKIKKGTLLDNVFTSEYPSGGKAQNRFNWGAGVRFGVEIMDKYQVVLGYDRGLNRFSYDFGISRTNLFSVSAAYMF